MKARKLAYEGLVISDDQDDLGARLGSSLGLFEKMARGEMVRFHPILDMKMGTDEHPIIDEESKVLAIIHSIQCPRDKFGLIIWLDAREVPRGMRPGKYTLTFNEDLVCIELPNGMSE